MTSYVSIWGIGALQSDAANLTAENVDWPTRMLSYIRMKTGEHAQMTISSRLEAILNQLPNSVGRLISGG